MTDRAEIHPLDYDPPDATGAFPMKRDQPKRPAPAESPRVRQVREAVEAVGNAALGITRRVEAIETAQATLGGLRAELQEAMAGLTAVVRDLTRAQPRKTVKATGGGIRRVGAVVVPREGSIARAIWDRLPATAAAIAEDLDMPLARIRQNAENLRQTGRITSDVTADGVVFRRLDQEPPEDD